MKGVNDMKLKRCEMNTRMMFALVVVGEVRQDLQD